MSPGDDPSASGRRQELLDELDRLRRRRSRDRAVSRSRDPQERGARRALRALLLVGALLLALALSGLLLWVQLGGDLSPSTGGTGRRGPRPTERRPPTLR